MKMLFTCFSVASTLIPSSTIYTIRASTNASDFGSNLCVRLTMVRCENVVTRHLYILVASGKNGNTIATIEATTSVSNTTIAGEWGSACRIST